MVAGELLGQLETLLALRGVDHAQQPEFAQQVDGALDRDDVDAAPFQSLADLGHGHGRRVIDERLDDGLARAREAKASTGHGRGDRVTRVRGGGGHG